MLCYITDTWSWKTVKTGWLNWIELNNLFACMYVVQMNFQQHQCSFFAILLPGFGFLSVNFSCCFKQDFELCELWHVVVCCIYYLIILLFSLHTTKIFQQSLSRICFWAKSEVSINELQHAIKKEISWQVVKFGLDFASIIYFNRANIINFGPSLVSENCGVD